MNNTNWEASSLQDLLHMPYVIPLPGANATAQDMVEALGQPCGAPPPLSYVLCLKDNHAKRVLSSLSLVGTPPFLDFDTLRFLDLC